MYVCIHTVWICMTMGVTAALPISVYKFGSILSASLAFQQWLGLILPYLSSLSMVARHNISIVAIENRSKANFMQSHAKQQYDMFWKCPGAHVYSTNLKIYSTYWIFFGQISNIAVYWTFWFFFFYFFWGKLDKKQTITLQGFDECNRQQVP